MQPEKLEGSLELKEQYKDILLKLILTAKTYFLAQ